MSNSTKDLYLDLIKRSLTDAVYGERYIVLGSPRNPLKRILVESLRHRGIQLIRNRRADSFRTAYGDWPLFAHTMLPRVRLDVLQQCIEDVIKDDDVPGDLIETGVWRGGATIFMRGVLKANQIEDRCVWVADSFEGLPPPNPDKYPADSGDIHHTYQYLAVSLEEVKANFEAYGLLDNQVKFLKGWFRDTLPTLSTRKWAVVRLDGDMYESTMDAFTNLYPNLSVGGYLVVDDYNISSCRQAVHDYRETKGITDQIQFIDECAIYWRRA